MSQTGGLSKLIEALTIFKKYGDPEYPTHCEHDAMYIVGIKFDDVSDEDKSRLEELGFVEDSEDGGFLSFHFGSA